MRRIAILIVLGVLCSSPSTARGRVTTVRTGPRMNKTTDRDWLLHPCDDSTYNESWNLIVEADAVVDHWVQNVIAGAFAERWWTIRFFSPTRSIIAHVVQLDEDHDRGRFTRFLLTHGSGVEVFSDRLIFRPARMWGDPAETRYASRFRFSWKGEGLQLTGLCDGQRTHDRVAIMEEMGWAQRQVAKLFAGNPIIYRLEGQAEVALESHDAEPVTLTGPVLMESIILE